MKYALNLAEDNRILSACVVLPNGKYDGMPIVEEFPEDNLPDYQYINNEFIYNPLPKEEPVEPSEPKPTVEERLTALENTVNTTVVEYNEVLKEFGVET